jgi:lysophospholipase L1-like esterase
MPGREAEAQKKMHLEKTGWDDATSSTKAERDAARSANAGKVVAVGDSLAVGIAGSTKGTEQVAKEGLKPSQILSNIGSMISKDPNYFRGKKVILSSGISNSAVDKDGNINKSDFDIVKQQIDLLKGAGAESIDLVGVGPNAKFEQNGVNSKLQALADGKYVRFSDISGMTFDKLGIHPTAAGYKEIHNKALSAPPAPAPSSNNTGDAVDISSRTATDSAPKVVVVGNQSSGPKEESEDEIQRYGIADVYDSALLWTKE